MRESGEFASIAELVSRQAMAPSYKTRVLRNTLLPQAVVESIMAEQDFPQMRSLSFYLPFLQS